MPPPLFLTDVQAAQLRALVKTGASWDAIAAQLGVSRNKARGWAKEVGIWRPRKGPAARPDRCPCAPPLQAGHPSAWSLIALRDEPYPFPVFLDNPRRY